MKTFKEFLSITEQQVIGPSKKTPLRTPTGKAVRVPFIDVTAPDRRLKEYERLTNQK